MRLCILVRRRSSTHQAQIACLGAAGFSLGGYLAGRACAGLSDRLAACFINPANIELPYAFNVTAEYELPIYGGLAVCSSAEPQPAACRICNSFCKLIEHCGSTVCLSAVLSLVLLRPLLTHLRPKVSGGKNHYIRGVCWPGSAMLLHCVLDACCTLSSGLLSSCWIAKAAGMLMMDQMLFPCVCLHDGNAGAASLWSLLMQDVLAQRSLTQI